jgi:hypothetical protein
MLLFIKKRGDKMQTVTWSQDLHKAVKKVKHVGPIHSKSLLTDKNFISSLSLLPSEEKSIKKTFSTNIQVFNYWA